MHLQFGYVLAVAERSVTQEPHVLAQYDELHGGCPGRGIERILPHGLHPVQVDELQSVAVVERLVTDGPDGIRKTDVGEP